MRDGTGRAGGDGPRVSVRSVVRGGAAARGAKVHERGGGLRAGPRRCCRRRRRGAEADSSEVTGGSGGGCGGGDTHPQAARPCSPRPRAPGRGAPAAASPAPRSWPLPPRGWARSPPPEPARLHSGRRLLPHPLQHVVYPVILDHHCAGRKRVRRTASGGAARRSEARRGRSASRWRPPSPPGSLPARAPSPPGRGTPPSPGLQPSEPSGGRARFSLPAARSRTSGAGDRPLFLATT